MSAATDCFDVITVAYDCREDRYRYDPAMGKTLTGNYDGRAFPHILAQDGVAALRDAEAVGALLDRARTDRGAARETLSVRLHMADGALRPFTVRIAGEYGADGAAERLFLLLAEESGGAAEAPEQTVRDELTGLPGRREFLMQVEQRVKNAPPSTYIMVYFDVDQFSMINDRYGHRQGDALLRFIAQTTETACRRKDALCARLDADRFAVCAPNSDVIVARFLDEYQKGLEKADNALEVSVSFGLCVIDDPLLSPEVALDHAALAQRSVKGSYVTRYAYYDEDQRRSRLRRQEIEGQMRAALQRGQFDIYIQPQFELATGRLTGGEALVRWFHPEWGVVPPGEFISIFEQNGFISELDGFVWERACRQLQKWIAEDGEKALPLSVNLSRIDLRNADVVERLAALTEQYGVPPRLLRLEITESAYADNPRQLLDVVRSLQSRGFSVEMDDFGSGYSSLNTLKDVPVNALKLDLRFLAGDATSGRGGSIINSVIRMTRWLQLPVIAEGVETEQQAAYLRSVGCDFAQGYLYAKPLPVPEFEALMHAAPTARLDASLYVVDMADANAFWNPDSQETLIFNSYVGGAAIMEYAEGHVELLRANDKFFDMMHEENLISDVYILEKTMQPEDRATFLQMLEDAASTGKEATCTVRLREGQAGVAARPWLRNRARMLCKSRSRTIFYIAVEDVSAEHEAQRRFHTSQSTLIAAAAHTHLQYWMYNMIERTSIQGVESPEYKSGVPVYLEDYPESLLALGYVHPDFIAVYRKLHTDLQAGARTVSADVLTGGEGHWEWRKVRYTAVEDDDGVVRRAIGTSESLSAYKELEQRFVIAAQRCGLMTWILDVRRRSIQTDMLAQLGTMQEAWIDDMPESFIRMGRVYPDDEGAFRAAYERMYAGADEAEATVRFRDAKSGKGHWCWHRLTFTAMTDKDGRTGFAVCTAVNVDEQVNMQVRYREALAYYENLDPEAYVAILHANLTRDTIDAQGGGVAPYQNGESLLSCIPDDAERAAMAEFLRMETLSREYAKGASLLRREYRQRFPDGAVRWVCTTVRLLMDTGNQELCAFLYTQDINEEKMKALVFERIVLEDYDFVTIIDTEHDRFLTFITDSGDTFIPSPEQYTFSEAAAVFAARTAPEADARVYIEKTRFPYMMERLAREGGYAFLYRERLDDGSFREKRMSVRLIDAQTKHVCLTRMDVGRLVHAEGRQG